MSKVEESLAKIRNNVAKLDLQIETLLKGLLQENILEESSLEPLLVQNQQPKSKEPVTNSKAGKSATTGKLGTFALSSKRKATSMAHMEEITESLTNKVNLESGCEKIKSRLVAKKCVFTAIDSESFFAAVMDQWVFRVTLINSSKVAQKLPDMILSIVNRNGNVLGQPFAYKFKTFLINVDKNFHYLDDPNVLPVEEALPVEADVDPRILETQIVKPGSKFAASACFSHPIMPSFDAEDELSVIVSLVSDEKTVWSKFIPFDSKAYDSFYNESILATFSDQISIAMSQLYKNFKLECLDCKSSELVTSFDEFVTNKLKLTNVRTVATRFDTQTRTYCSQKLNIFWGFVLEVEYCERNENRIRATVYTRTPEQLFRFYKLLFHWVQEQRVENQAVVVSYDLSKKTDAIPELLRKEIKTVIHFLYLNHRRMIDEGSDAILRAGEFESNLDISVDLTHRNKMRIPLKWLKTYVSDMISTDSMFMLNYDS